MNEILSANDVILVVDDEMFTRFMTHELLQRIGGPRVLSARDLAEARGHLNGPEAGAVRLALLDVQLPDGTGLELLRDIRCGRLAAASDLPVMIVTGQDSLGVAAAAIALDVDAFVGKPLSADSLRDHLGYLLGTHRLVEGPEYYSTIDIGGISAPAVPLPAAQHPADAVGVEWNELTPGVRIVCDILGPAGELLVQRNTVLTERLIRLLHGLKNAGMALDTIFIEAGHGG